MYCLRRDIYATTSLNHRLAERLNIRFKINKGHKAIALHPSSYDSHELFIESGIVSHVAKL